MSDHFNNMLLTLDAVFPVDTRTDLERPGLSTSTNACMGDAQRGTLGAGITESASRPADSITLENGERVEIELDLVDWGGGMWSCGDARNCDRPGGWGRTRAEAIEDFRSVANARLPDPI